MSKINAIKRLIRMPQWVKNFFLFIPVFFAGELFNLDKLIPVLWGFAAFCLASSMIYIINDLRDMKFDRLHPEKSKRPLASGELSPRIAYVAIAILFVLDLIICASLKFEFIAVLGSYVFINLLYSFGLKRISILDIIMVSTGFVLRTVSGGILAEVEISSWLIIMIFLLSLFLVIAKRREDILEYLSSGRILRRSIEKYNIDFINSVLTMLCGVIIVSYIMYTISPEAEARFGTRYLFITSIFVITGLMRYLQITLVENKSGSPVKILYTDRFIHITLLLWVFSFFLLLYLSDLAT